MGDLMDQLLKGIKGKEKKTPVKVHDLSPEDRTRYEDAVRNGKAAAKQCSEIAFKARSVFQRFWLDMDDKYSLHATPVHVHNGALYKGSSDEADHKDVDPLDEDND